MLDTRSVSEQEDPPARLTLQRLRPPAPGAPSAWRHSAELAASHCGELDASTCEGLSASNCEGLLLMLRLLRLQRQSRLLEA